MRLYLIGALILFSNTFASGSSFKGYELYIWTIGGETHYSLLIGTNRLKSVSEIIEKKESSDSIVNKLESPLFRGEFLVINSPIDVNAKSNIVTNPKFVDFQLKKPTVSDLRAVLKACEINSIRVNK